MKQNIITEIKCPISKGKGPKYSYHGVQALLLEEDKLQNRQCQPLWLGGEQPLPYQH